MLVLKIFVIEFLYLIWKSGTMENIDKGNKEKQTGKCQDNIANSFDLDGDCS